MDLRVGVGKSTVLLFSLFLLSLSFLFFCEDGGGSGLRSREERGLCVGTNLGAVDGDVCEFINAHWSENDVVTVRVENVEALKKVRKGSKELLLTARQYFKLKELGSLIKRYGVERLAFNMEGRFSLREYLKREREVSEFAKKRDMVFVFGPTLSNLLSHHSDFLRYAPEITIQAQRWQSRSDFRERVKELVEKLKRDRKDVRVWLQVSTAPPGNRDAGAEEVLESAKKVADLVEGLFVYHSPGKKGEWEKAEFVLRGLLELREKRSSSSVGADGEFE